MKVTQVNYPHLFHAFETIMMDGGDAPYQPEYDVPITFAPLLPTVNQALSELSDADLERFLVGAEYQIKEIANRSPQLMTAHRVLDWFLNEWPEEEES